MHLLALNLLMQVCGQHTLSHHIHHKGFLLVSTSSVLHLVVLIFQVYPMLYTQPVSLFIL